ncbi:MAG TPA: selenocysteine-specific translation elongation factor [Pseudomonas sabulinigri]|uniref:Tr-type G domain-containing protein n=1 Tax=marine sediment metagenome TaxID=412755 RepID=A0A0F9V6V9_9ZZZZ|nr:selenocysteine-specific translation elongation factor [Halopseudomonas sabulinigri]HEC50687.1 selenocysteine-specific translation elongation factor [Halopseudomonas sabulinigri]
MIIASAGHVDHGKTALIKALTGEDTDRLAEEKRRGLTIELGFAWLPTEKGAPLGFVDVPGHERFISTMLAGVTGVDMAMLVVAADDGIMPQTREHLNILRLLGVGELCVVLSRCDLADAAQQQQVAEHVVELLADDWPAAPVWTVSSLTGQGIDDLRAHLVKRASELAAQSSSGHARLMVDRRFSIPGSGCVVTGTLVSGALQPGQRLLCGSAELRVRGLQIASKEVATVQAGQRCAINLTGAVTEDQPRRGDWLNAVALPPSDRLDVALQQLPDSHWHRGVLQLHMGTGVYPVKVVVLDGSAEPVLAQLVLEQPLQAVWGDRFIIRDPAANTTLGGGRILDPRGQRRGRSKPPRLALLRDWQSAKSPEQALIAVLAQSEVELQPFAQRFNLTEAELHALLGQTQVLQLAGFVLSPTRSELALRQLHARLSDWHAAHPEQLGPGEGELALVATLQLPLPLGRALLRHWLDAGRLQRQAWAWYLNDHKPQLQGEDQALLERVSVQLLPGELRPPIVGELATQLGMELDQLKLFLQRMQRAGELIAVAPNRYYLPAQVEALVAVAKQLAAASPSGSFNAAEYRDASGIGRNLTIQVLEYLDRAGVTRFVREQRFLAAG